MADGIRRGAIGAVAANIGGADGGSGEAASGRAGRPPTKRRASGLTAAAGDSLVALTMKSTSFADGRRPPPLAMLLLLALSLGLAI
ncbi:MAG TPA: hypothetical protein VNF49_10025, partial [Candidatus Binataceae bacterium]|nr:hypothetical protein [Candidatus Binataceae bacterium]